MQQGYYIRRRIEDGWSVMSGIPITRIISPGKQLAMLEADILYVGRRGNMASARKGMVYDGGSKPRLSWGLAGHPYDEYLPAYTIHDAETAVIRHLIDSGAVTYRNAHRLRRQADRRFLEGLRWLSVSMLNQHGRWARILARIKYRAVRAHAAATIRRSW